MPSDPAVQVAAVSIFTTFITTIGIIIVAVLNNKKERTDAASEGIEETLRERILLRDEQILDLRDEVAFKDQIIQRLEADLKEAKRRDE